MTLSIAFGPRRLQPDLIANANQFAQRLNVESGLAQKHLQFAAAQIVNAIRCLKELVDDVFAHLAHLRNRSVSP